MYPISSAVAALFASEQTQVIRITGTDANSNAISITEADVMQNGFSIDRYSSNGTRIEVGTAISAQMSLRLKNTDGRFDSIAFEGTELFVEIGIADWSQVSPTVSYIPCGYFTVDEQKRHGNTISLVALDRMMRLESTPPTLMPWTDHSDHYIADHNGNVLFFNAALALPCTVAQLVRQICKRCYITLVDNLNSLPNYNYAVSSTVDAVQTSTYRSIIQWCAQIMGACAFMDWDGKLRFKWYSSADYTCNTTNRFTGELNANDITVTGVKYTTVDNVTYLAGTDAYSLDISSNYLITGNPSTLLTNLYNTVGGFTYRPFTATVTSAPYLYPTDIITYVDNGGTSQNCILTNVNTTANGHTVLAGQGETETINTYAPPSSMTVKQAAELKRVAEQAKTDIQSLDHSLTQQEIFDRLTDGGLEQGLALEAPIPNAVGANGEKKIFLNMDYARFGKLLADFIQGGTLSLGGYNNINGVLNIVDAGSNVIGVWDKDGISINKGAISGTNGNYWDLSNTGQIVAKTGAIGDFTIGGGKLSSTGTTYKSSFGTDGLEYEENDSYYGWVKTRLRGNGLYFDTTVSNNYVLKGQVFSDAAGLVLHGGGGHEGLIIGNESVVCELDFSVYGTKSRITKTDQYSDRLLYCYETPSPLFGDVGEGVISDDGKCYVWLDPVFAETITTSQYQVFLQKYGDGDCWIADRKPGYFVVNGTPGLAFGWELKAKQKDFDQMRLDKADMAYEPNRTDYGAYAAQHITEIQKARVSA